MGSQWRHLRDFPFSFRSIVRRPANEIYKRAQSHWWARYREKDLFHKALSLDSDPFVFVVLPLEFIPYDLYTSKYERRLGRERVRMRFREVAIQREKYSTGKLNSLWPFGWNSIIPGCPLGACVLRKNSFSHPEPDAAAGEPDFQPSACWFGGSRTRSRP